jgi:3-phenylpropionate/trans-cinnamate dioxygenase ferredoxin reductase subunit
MISGRVGAKRVVIVGGGGGGDAVAFALRKRGYDGDVLILSADVDRPYDRPYLSKEFLRGEIELQKVFLHDEAEYSKEEIQLRLRERVVGGSMTDRSLSLQSGGEVKFDILVLSTGGTPRRLPDAPDSSNVLTLRSLRDSQAVRDALKKGTRLLLVGAGFIGAEVGASARQLGKEVLMVESAPVPLARSLGVDVGEVYASIHRSKGVDLRTGTTVKAWHTSGGVVAGVTLSDGKREEVDVVLIAIGIDPNLEVPRGLGLPIEGTGVRVDSGLRAADGVYCAGDIALHPHPVLEQSIRVEHWEVAKHHGRGIATAIASGDAPVTRLPYFWSDQYDVSLEYRGHASGDDRAVWRGDKAGLRFSVFYIRDGRIYAVLSMNDKNVNEIGGKLIEGRWPVDEKLLADHSTDLSELVPPG